MAFFASIVTNNFYHFCDLLKNISYQSSAVGEKYRESKYNYCFIQYY